MKDPHYFTIGPWVFEVDNFKDWEPGYQLHLDHGLRGVLNTDKTFSSVQEAEAEIKNTLRELAERLIKELV